MSKYLMLKKGDVVTFITNNGGYVDKEVITSLATYNFQYLKEKFDGKIIKIERPINYKTIYEGEEEEILDEVEKKWLGNFVEPLRDKIYCIVKHRVLNNSGEWLRVIMRDSPNIDLPKFKPNKMYKGMKINKEYTLEELGL